MRNRFILAAIFLIIVSSASLSLSQTDASYVLGSRNLNAEGTILSPQGVYMSSSSGKVFVSNGTQILRFDSNALTMDGTSPEAVLGNSDVCDDGGLISLGYITIDESDSLWGADQFGNRIFKAESISSTTNLSFSLVLGQNSFAHCGGNIGDRLNQMLFPSHALVDPTKNDLWVVDGGNNRVLRFSSASSLTTGASAATFLGTGYSGASAASLDNPTSVAVDPQGNLYVADTQNFRVVRFDNAHNLESGAKASFVLGQTDFNFPTNNGEPTQSSINPTFIFLFDDVLYVSDQINLRVMIFSDVSTLHNGAPATNLLGQSNFNVARTYYPKITPFSINIPSQIYCNSGSLLAVSSNEDRVLRFDMPLPLYPSS